MTLVPEGAKNRGMNFVCLNGDILPQNQAFIPVNDRSFLFGEGLFETILGQNGKIPLLKEHLNRLEWSCEFLGIPFPAQADFNGICSTLMTKNSLKDARLKIVVSSHDADADEPGRKERLSNWVVFCEPLPASPATFRLKTIRNAINDAAPLAAMKTTNYLVKTYGRREAQATGYDDGILLNAQGQVTETTTGNLFWIDESGVLKTAPESCGLLRGIMRQALLKLLKDNNLKYREDVITPENLSSMREVFVTNSLQGIKPVIQIDHRKISGGETGSITSMLMDLWKKWLSETQ